MAECRNCLDHAVDGFVLCRSHLEREVGWHGPRAVRENRTVRLNTQQQELLGIENNPSAAEVGWRLKDLVSWVEGGVSVLPDIPELDVEKTSPEELRRLNSLYEEVENDPHLVLKKGWQAAEKRDLPNRGVQNAWIHVLNGYVNNPLAAIESLCSIDGEICCSEAEDWEKGTLLQTNERQLLAAVLDGPAEAVWDCDVWSYIDSGTGRRVAGNQEGGNRTEAWVRPSQCRLLAVICTNKDWADQLRNAGITVWTSPNGHGQQFVQSFPEEEKLWDKACCFDEDWM